MARGTKYSRVHVETASGPATTGHPDRRRELIEIAGQLFADQGFLATTIRDVADAAGIQSGSLYHHFSSKESMADELLREYWSILVTRYEAVIATGASPTEQARQMVRESVLQIGACNLAVRMLMNDWTYLSQIFPYMDASMGQIEQFWIKNVEKGIATGEFSAEVAPNIVYRTVMSAIGGTARWYRVGGTLPIDQLADDIARVFLRGITTRTT